MGVYSGREINLLFKSKLCGNVQKGFIYVSAILFSLDTVLFPVYIWEVEVTSNDDGLRL